MGGSDVLTPMPEYPKPPYPKPPYPKPPYPKPPYPKTADCDGVGGDSRAEGQPGVFHHRKECSGRAGMRLSRAGHNGIDSEIRHDRRGRKTKSRRLRFVIGSKLRKPTRHLRLRQSELCTRAGMEVDARRNHEPHRRKLPDPIDRGHVAPLLLDEAVRWNWGGRNPHFERHPPQKIRRLVRPNRTHFRTVVRDRPTNFRMSMPFFRPHRRSDHVAGCLPAAVDWPILALVLPRAAGEQWGGEAQPPAFALSN